MCWRNTGPWVLDRRSFAVVLTQRRQDAKGSPLAGPLPYPITPSARLAATNDGVMLATVFDAIEQIGETTGRIGCSDIWHTIRLSDSCSQVKAHATPITSSRRVTSLSRGARDRHIQDRPQDEHNHCLVGIRRQGPRAMPSLLVGDHVAWVALNRMTWALARVPAVPDDLDTADVETASGVVELPLHIRWSRQATHCLVS